MFPYVEHEKISTTVLFIVSLVAPAVIIFFVVMLLVPGPTAPPGTPKSLIFKRKLWEWNVGWLGLALALALSFFLTQGMKNMFGKPRPDLLSRCDPDTQNLAAYALGGYPNVRNGLTLVSSTICREKDKSKIDDGFSSFPSGHSSYSWAGMTYLALFLASKFSVAIPFLLPFAYSNNSPAANAYSSDGSAYGSSQSPTKEFSSIVNYSHVPLRKQAAAPPTYLLILPLIPICAAIYISSTRFSDFRHHGFDIIFGSLMGLLLAYTTFRLYHLPIRRGGGWSWAPRSPSRAFGVGVGRAGYIVNEDAPPRKDDLESGGKYPAMESSDAGLRDGMSSSQTQRI
ncbi:MAG: hypothetical protein LQ342_002281 [Letrouitia transgressa]|nr:MAG: hypothetical protein LQ342_002281 [Letrouitia transgressa]